MGIVKLSGNIYFVGVIDWNVRNFHGRTYNTKRGTTYNAYLIVDEKVTLIDTVHQSYSEEFISNISKVVSLDKIDYIVVNHVEVDHSGALPKIIKLCPKAKLFGTERCKDGIKKYYHENWDFQTVKTGDKLNLGEKNLMFIEAPMLHWPDSMFTYLVEDKILFSNDAFGQHLATSQRFDDEVDSCALMDEAAKYYANILWPLSSLVYQKIEQINQMNIALNIIAPSHGVIWRREPSKILTQYKSWAKNEIIKKVVVVYETMWGATERMALKIVEGILDSGVEVKLYNIAQSDITEVIKDMLDAKGFLFGSSTHDNDKLPVIAGFLEFFKGLKPKNRVASVFGSYGWGGGAIKSIENILKGINIEILQTPLSIQYMPNEEQLKECYDFGMSFAKKL